MDTVSASGLTIVIPTKGLAGMLQYCLEHLQRALKVASQFEPCVVVVDNATEIPLLEKDLPSSSSPVHLIRFDIPASFAEANNLATVMAWDAVMRGLIHWDSLSPKPPLAMLTGLPVAAGKVPPWRMRFKKWLGRRQSTRFVLHSVMYRMGWLSRGVRKTFSQ